VEYSNGGGAGTVDWKKDWIEVISDIRPWERSTGSFKTRDNRREGTVGPF
jgi:hypothetical protein